jgi:uncharacterized protein with PIN domain
MAIPCPGCGREYDVTLFQFGRTIHCTCGRRVGLEKRVELGGRSGAGGPPGAQWGALIPGVDAAVAGETPLGRGPARFLADAMLGGLARWLRVLGYDTVLDPEAPDGELVRRSVEERRILLTRDRKLPEEWRVEGVLLLESQAPMDQLREVVTRLDLAGPWPFFTRCTLCNRLLEAVPATEVAEALPARVVESVREFARCPECGRLYWEGSHTRRMQETLERVLSGS